MRNINEKISMKFCMYSVNVQNENKLFHNRIRVP